MSDGNVCLKTHVAGIEFSLIEIAHYAAPIQILLADSLLISDQREGVNDDSQNQSEENLEN